MRPKLSLGKGVLLSDKRPYAGVELIRAIGRPEGRGAYGPHNYTLDKSGDFPKARAPAEINLRDQSSALRKSG